MSTSKKKKTAREKRVLIASLIVAGTIVAGSTFAWFTSKDEVTNRLSANANYNVAIAETFTAPEEWVPGQDVNKDVFAINTGTIDALVKETISGKISVTKETEGADLTATQVPTGAVKLGTQYSTSTNSITGTTYTADEVTSIMAGSVLAYTDNTTDVAKVGRITVNVDGTTVPSGTTTAPASGTATDPGESAEGTHFTPAGKGLYIFRRVITTENNTEKYSYSGYYFDGTTDYYKISLDSEALNKLIEPGNNGVLTKALDVNATTGEYEVKTAEVGTVKAAAKYIIESSDSGDVKLSYEAAVTTAGSEHPARLVATYDGADADSTNDDIVIYINLQNIDNTGTTADKWQMLPATLAANATKAEFFYTNDLEAGQTSKQLIDSLSLAETTSNDAYKSFDFDLNIALNSVQITKTSDGTELLPGATAAGAATKITEFGASATATNGGKEINVVKWEKTTT